MKNPHQFDLDEKVSALLGLIIDASFSVDSDRLNRLVGSPEMCKVLQGELGVEIANFFCFDPYKEKVVNLHKAVPGAIEMPFYRLEVDPERTAKFTAIKRSSKEIEDYRRLEEYVMSDPKQGGTVQKVRHNLRNSSRVRSSGEINRQWTLVPKGEIALYTFEWLVILGLEAKKIDRFEDAERLLLSSDLIERQWRSVYEDVSGPYRNMLGRGLESYKAALHWLIVSPRPTPS